jgi:Secretion system C-terminal sorting domain
MKCFVIFNNIFQLSFLISILFVSYSVAQVTVTKDTIYISGGTLSGRENAGLMETTINSDVDSQKVRINPNRVYALYEGQIYYQLAPINVNNPTGTLTIEGIPDPKHPTANTKPIILILPVNQVHVVINVGGTNQVYGSLKFVNIYYQTMQTDGYQNNELFYCGTANKLPQSLTIDNCLFEFCNIDLFDCTNESGAIGGWPYGAKFRITNSYFRNLFQNGQWWGSRVFQCKHPIDTLWVDNSTFTTGGLLFLQQNELTDFTYINHNTIINNKKYWLLSPYKHIEFITNNIFVNQSWVGEDTNETSGGQGPSVPFISTIDIDPNTFINANGLQVQKKFYLNGDSTKFTSDLALKNLNIYVSNNINYYGPELISGYYKSPKYLSNAVTPPALVSYIAWNFPGPTIIKNIPGEWMNTRTKAIFKNYSPPIGGFIEENTITTMPQTTTSITLDAGTVDAMAQWNQNQYQDPAWPSPLPTNILNTNYIYGDYDPTTLPGIINGVKSDKVTGEAAGTQVGIRTFTDLTENFYQTANKSTIDGLPIGSLIWNDAAIKAYNSKAAWGAVIECYRAWGAIFDEVLKTGIPAKYSLSQNYPNPFNPTTIINYSITKPDFVTIKVYDILGREVMTLVNENKPTGNYNIKFNGSKLVSGIYFYRMQAGDFVQTKKLVLIK